MMKQLFVPLLALVGMQLHAQPDPIKSRFAQSCTFPPPDSVDITGDGIADLVVRGMHGVATCDIPVSVGSCEVHVATLPGTLLLSGLHPMGGRVLDGFSSGDVIPPVDVEVQDDLRIPMQAFIEGSIPALHWTYGRNGVSAPKLTPTAKRTFIFATTMGERTVHGTFTIERERSAGAVSVRVRGLFDGGRPFIVP